MMNALMPGEHNYQLGQPMPGQAAAPMAQPAKKRNPLMNALSTVFEVGAPEAFEQGRQKRITRDVGNALAGGDYAGAANTYLKGGNIEQGLAVRGMGQEQDMAKRQQEAQSVLSLFSQMPALQINEMAMSDPANFERMTGMTSEEYLQAAQRSGDPEKFREYVITKAQAELGQMPATPEPYTLAPGAARYGADGRMIANNPVTEKSPGYEQITLADGEYEYIPGQPESLRKLGASPVKTPMVSVTLPGEKGENKFQEGLGTQAATNFQTIVDQGRAAGAAIGNLDTMETLLDSIDYTGFGGDTLLQVQRAGAMLGIEIEDLPAKEAAKRLSSQMALSLKTDLPGPMSNADREFLLSIPPNLNSTAAGNDAILFILRKREERKQDMMQSLLQADPQSMEEYRAWENQYLQSTPPMFTPATQASLLKALGGASGGDSPQ